MDKSEARWQAEGDAYTLSQAEEIKNDPSRLQAAKAVADDMARDKMEEARNLNKIADKPAPEPREVPKPEEKPKPGYGEMFY